ncbi:MAG: zinc-ribbon domain-containing protein [Candidatus Hodarchaeota archaeon]
MVYCETCGIENNQTAKYCKNCGASIVITENKSFSGPNPPSGNTSIGFGDRNTGENLVLRCSLCNGQDFAKDSGRLDSKWGFTSFKVIMLSCRRCGHIELFNKGRSIFDFD